MCGRYLLLTEEENIEYREIINEINERYKDKPLFSSLESKEIFPSDIAPVLVAENNKKKAALLKWGFPRWHGSGLIINARLETALEKNLFRRPLLKSRCAIPAAGFFEWRKEEGRKVKYLFHSPDISMLYFAGFSDSFTVEKIPFNAYVILTAAANEYMCEYHNRMPLILGSENIDKWLFDTDYALEYLSSPCDTKLYASMV